MVNPVELRQWLDGLTHDSPIKVAFNSLNFALATNLARQVTIATTIPVPMLNTGQIMGLLSPQSFAACFDSPRYSNFEVSYNNGSREGVKLWADAFMARGLITLEERIAIHAFLDSTIETQVLRWPNVTIDDFILASEVNL